MCAEGKTTIRRFNGVKGLVGECAVLSSLLIRFFHAAWHFAISRRQRPRRPFKYRLCLSVEAAHSIFLRLPCPASTFLPPPTPPHLPTLPNPSRPTPMSLYRTGKRLTRKMLAASETQRATATVLPLLTCVSVISFGPTIKDPNVLTELRPFLTRTTFSRVLSSQRQKRERERERETERGHKGKRKEKTGWTRGLEIASNPPEMRL
jgi:hypothetical protein